jgi:hypothetical protein
LQSKITLQQATLNNWRITRGQSQQTIRNIQPNNNLHGDNNNNLNYYNINNTNNTTTLNHSNDLINNTQSDFPCRNRSRNRFAHPSLRQQTILHPSLQRRCGEDANWGHYPSSVKPPGIFRLGFRNINSLPVQRSDSKNLQIVLDVKSLQLDCLGVTEVNLAWQNLPYVDQMEERFRGMFEFATYTSANNRDPTFHERQQSGGTMMIVNGFTCAQVCHSDRDKRTLGRWCSNLLRGKHGLKLRIITVYRPVVSKGSLSAYQQQRCILLDNNIDTCPRMQLLQDLEIYITQCKDAGEQVIVMGDFNDDVRGRIINSFFTKLDMRELIIEMHKDQAPNTFRDGTLPIDGIFGTRNIQPMAGGYLDFNFGASSDHRMIWV